MKTNQRQNLKSPKTSIEVSGIELHKFSEKVSWVNHVIPVILVILVIPVILVSQQLLYPPFENTTTCIAIVKKEIWA